MRTLMLSQREGMLRALCLAAVLFGAAQTSALAQVFPSGLVRIVMPYPPGSPSDAVARAIASGLSSQWPHQVIVENRPGGNTLIGMGAVARAEPDGHTLFFTSDDSFTILPHLMRNMPFDPMRELVPVNLSAKVSMVMVVSAAGPVDSLQALITRARANPGALSYGSYGTGSSAHLAMETLKSMAKIDILHVPYKGVPAAIAAVAAGDVQVALSGYSTARGLIDGGRLRPIAIASTERLAQLPNVPTTGELGYGEVDATVWFGIAAPAKTPAETVKRINEAISRALNSPETRKVIEDRGYVVVDIGPKPFAELLARRFSFNAEAVRRSGAKVD